MGTPTEIIFRRMLIDDIQAVAEMDEICFGEDGWSEYFFACELLDKNSEYIVGEIEGKVVACSGLKFYPEGAYGMTIAVLPEFQGRGIGKKLFAEIIERAKKRGAKLMIFEVRVNNDSAIHIYKKFGFKIVDRIKDYYMGGEDAFRMYANLGEINANYI